MVFFIFLFGFGKKKENTKTGKDDENHGLFQQDVLKHERVKTLFTQVDLSFDIYLAFRDK